MSKKQPGGVDGGGGGKQKDPVNEALTKSVDRRELGQRLSRHDQYLSALQLASSLGCRAKTPIDDQRRLQALVDDARKQLQVLVGSAQGKIHPRHRPRKRRDDAERPRCLIYLDECGSHAGKIGSQDFGAFVLAAAIVREEDLDGLNRRIRDWKLSVWRRSDVILHEPELRRGNGKFWFGGDRSRAREALDSLRDLIPSLPFKGIAVVVHRENYAELVGDNPLDDSLPEHVYHLALDFLCERVTMTLESDYGGAIGTMIAESRGPKEDALLQFEFVRLHLEGTSYVADTWFRYQLVPGIVFQPKTANLAGLQVADLMARPVGEKVLAPSSEPPRWEEFRAKLVATQKTMNSPLGLKVMPWRDEYTGIWSPKS